MKKILILILVAATLVFVLTGCNTAASPTMAWADAEVLKYDITDSASKEKLGTMTITTQRTTLDNTLSGNTYSSNTKTSIEIETNAVKSNTVILSNAYTALALSKTYEDKLSADKNYTLEARQVGKNYVYSLNGEAEKKIKTGSGYTFSEFVYQYIRCYPASSAPSSIKIADPLNGQVATVTAANSGAEERLTVPYPDETKEINCSILTVSLSDSPVGKSIYVSFIPDKVEYEIQGLSMTPSKKIPAKIVENNLTYTLSYMRASDKI
ncbi:hypothetical protein EOM82_00035 [bacterium]|nr:hypothetical protein [bacterium]